MLDPFVGSGTTCRVAKLLQRQWLGVDLNPDYIAMSERRLGEESPLLDSYDPRTERAPKDLPKDDLAFAEPAGASVRLPGY